MPIKLKQGGVLLPVGQLFVLLNGVPANVKSAYILVNGEPRLWFSEGGGGSGPITGDAYDALQLTDVAYDAKQLTAEQYDTNAMAYLP